MSYPSEYEKAVTNLKALRKSIESTFIAGRIKALLDASKETLNKYKAIIWSKSVTPTTFDNINRKNLLFWDTSMAKPEGGIAQISAKYTGATSEYPVAIEPAVKKRTLPQVDYFRYPLESISDPDFLENASEEVSRRIELTEKAVKRMRDELTKVDQEMAKLEQEFRKIQQG